MEDLSESGRQSVILGARRQTTLPRSQPPSTPRQPRPALLPRLPHSAPQPPAGLPLDQLVTFYPHRQS